MEELQRHKHHSRCSGWRCCSLHCWSDHLCPSLLRTAIKMDIIEYQSILALHLNLDLMRVSGMAYTKSRMFIDHSKCKQSGSYKLTSSCRLTAAGKRITRCVFDEWKRVRKMSTLARTHMKRSAIAFFCRDTIQFLLLINNNYEMIVNFFPKMIILITTRAFLKRQSIELCKVYNLPGVRLTSEWNNFKNDL